MHFIRLLSSSCFWRLSCFIRQKWWTFSGEYPSQGRLKFLSPDIASQDPRLAMDTGSSSSHRKLQSSTTIFLRTRATLPHPHRAPNHRLLSPMLPACSTSPCFPQSGNAPAPWKCRSLPKCLSQCRWWPPGRGFLTAAVSQFTRIVVATSQEFFRSPSLTPEVHFRVSKVGGDRPFQEYAKMSISLIGMQMIADGVPQSLTWITWILSICSL